MSQFTVAPEAEDDLRQIWRYLLAEAGLATADRIQNDLLAALEGLAEIPAKGHRRPDLTGRDVLFLGVYQYLIVYRRVARVEIVAILHGKRDAKSILKERLTNRPSGSR